MRNLLLLCTFFCLPTSIFAQNAPDFTVTTSSGEEVSLYADLLNQGKTVVLKFYFTFCPPCNAIAPQVEDLYQEWGSGANDMQLISLSTQGSDKNTDVAAHKLERNLTYPGVGSDGGSTQAVIPYTNGTYGTFLGTPTFVVIAPDGSVNFDVRGSNYAGTIAALDAAISATGAVKPNNEVLNSYTASGVVYAGNGNIYSNPNITINTETGSSVLNSNPFQITTLTENTDISILLNAPNTSNLTGVSTFDLVLINNHVLGIQEFEEAYQFIAADANNDGFISTFDIILLRQLILSIVTELPDNRNWLIFQQHPSQLGTGTQGSNPFLIDQIGTNISNIDFTVVKIGDVDGDSY